MPLIFTAFAAATLCSMPSVHDGDTIRCGAERIRIANIDAPELRDSPSCDGWKRSRHWCDYQLGLRSRNALLAFVRRGNVMVHRTGTDRYGRTLATVTVNGQDAGAFLVRLHLARWWLPAR